MLFNINYMTFKPPPFHTRVHCYVCSAMFQRREYDGGHFGGGRGGRGGGTRWRGRSGFGFGSPEKGGGRSSFVQKSYSEEVHEHVEQLYNKKFKFHDDFHEWKLPDPSLLFHGGQREPPFQIPKLLDLKKTLNATKSKLDNKEMISWTKHTAFTNRSEVVLRMLRRDYNPELCTHVRVCSILFLVGIPSYNIKKYSVP